jgi:hypothetical protein
MARKLKTFQTSVGFYDLAIAAPSMKAPLEAWGAGSNLFHQGIAKETDDPDVVVATMSKPGMVLEHAKKAAAIQAEAEAVEKRSRAEDDRWERERERLQTALRRSQA